MTFPTFGAEGARLAPLPFPATRHRSLGSRLTQLPVQGPWRPHRPVRSPQCDGAKCGFACTIVAVAATLVKCVQVRRPCRQSLVLRAAGLIGQRCDDAGPIRRRVLLPGLATASVLAAAATNPAPAVAGELPAGVEKDYTYPNWPALPLAPYSRRRTLLTEVVPKQVWTLDQVFGTFYVYVPIRATVLAADGGLLVYAPVAATPECLRLVGGLEATYGPVRWIVLPSKAVEHKVLAGPFARKFPAAKFFVAPGQFSVPVDLPLSFLGLPSFEFIDPDPARLTELPWAGSCDTAVLDLGTFGEVAIFHRQSRTLLVTDTLVSIPEEPPKLLLDPEYSRALAYHARDGPADVAMSLPPSLEERRKGWARIALFANFFNPGALADGEVAVPEANGVRRPWRWQKNWEESFRRLRNGGRPFVAPIIRELILQQQPERARAYVERLATWPFVRVVSAHFDAPQKAGPRELRDAFAFLFSQPGGQQVPGPSYCAEDLNFLRDLQRSAVPDGQPVRATTPCGFSAR